ncbi:MAG: hypothetical protein U0Y68_11630 [Blastocatellia bacterium]
MRKFFRAAGRAHFIRYSAQEIYMPLTIVRKACWSILGCVLCSGLLPIHSFAQSSSPLPAGKTWSAEQRARESFARYQFHQQRRSPHASAEGNIVVTDSNDVSIVQDNGSILIPATPFTLSGRSILYTPSGNGYTVTSGLSSFDTNLGTKLNLTVSPAVNSANADPGDDAYISQGLNFNFNFYGTSYSSVAISSNGFVAFRPATSPYFDYYAIDSGESLYRLQTAAPRIAPYWHDLDARAVVTTGTTGIYLRNDFDRAVITWNNIRDYPLTASDNGIQRFQVILFSDGRIQVNYAQVQLTSSALVGISGGADAPAPQLVDFVNPPTTATSAPLATFFSLTQQLDDYSAVKAFYAAHPGQDNYDFVYVWLDFDANNALGTYLPIRNEISGNGQNTFDSDPDGLLGTKRARGIVALNNINTAYPDYPTTRLNNGSAHHALSLLGRETGHFWLAYPSYTQISQSLLLDSNFERWSFFLNTESGWSHPAAVRSSNLEGNVWKDAGTGAFTSTSLIDGYSKLDQYLMGLRPAEQVPDTFFAYPSAAPSGITRNTGTLPNVTILAQRLGVTTAQLIQANGRVTPVPDGTTKNYRAAVLLVEPSGQQPSAQTLAKLTRFRLAWESYFAQSTDYLATMNAGLAESATGRYITVTNGASYTRLVTPGTIASLFGQGLSNATVAASGSLPTVLNNIEVKIDGVSAPLFFVSSGQINFEVPRTIAATTTLSSGGTVQSSTSTVEVFSNGQLIRAGAVQVAPALMGTFTISQDGQGAAAALDAITFAAAPFNAKQANGQPNIVAAFVTGVGADVTDADGDVSSEVQATLNGQPVTVLYAGRAPGFVGLNQINFQLPADVSTGTYTLTLARSGFASNAATITIK